MKPVAIGSPDGRFCKIESLGWVEVNTETGEIIRQIPKRRIIEYNEVNEIIAVHDIEFSALLENNPNANFTGSRREIKLNKDDALNNLNADDIIKNYKHDSSKIVLKGVV